MATIYSNSISVKAIDGTSSAYTFFLEVILNSQDVVTRKSNITINAYAQGVKASYSSVSTPKQTITLYDNNTEATSTVVNAVTVSSIPKSKTRIATYTGDVTHKSDGTLNIRVVSSYKTGTNSYLPQANSISSGDITVTKINTYTIAPDFTAVVNSPTTINLTPNNSTYTHDISFKLGGMTSYTQLATGVKNTATITIPQSTYQYINSYYTTGTLRVVTKSGSNTIGTSDNTNFRVVINSDAFPTINATLTDGNSTARTLTGSSSTNLKLIPGKSILAYTNIAKTFNPTSYPATFSILTSGETNLGNVTSANVNYTTKGQDTTLYLVDSRTATAQKDFTITDIEWFAPSISAQFYRTSQASDDMNVKISCNWFSQYFGAQYNQLTIKYKWRVVGGTWSDDITLKTITASSTVKTNQISETITKLSGTWSHENAYEFVIIATDKLESSENKASLPKGVATFGFYQDGAILINGEWINRPKSCITATITNSWQQTTTSTFQKLTIDRLINKSGDRLSLENGGIKIGKGVKNVLVSAIAVNSAYTTAGARGIAIYQNGNTVCAAYASVGATTMGPMLPSKLLAVNEGDYIYLYVRTNTGNTTWSNTSTYTYLTVEEI